MKACQFGKLAFRNLKPCATLSLYFITNQLMPDLSTLKFQARSLLAPNGVMKVGLNVANFLLVHMPNPHEAPTGVHQTCPGPLPKI